MKWAILSIVLEEDKGGEEGEEEWRGGVSFINKAASFIEKEEQIKGKGRRKKQWKTFFSGPKWLQNVDLKIFQVLYRTPGIVQNSPGIV